MKIDALYAKEHEFRFKCLRPWLVLQPGDVFGSRSIMNLCVKQSQNTRYNDGYVQFTPHELKQIAEVDREICYNKARKIQWPET